ncbi:MAG: FecR family protein [Candidatus Marinimicrobia bacterium]|nr:FecR family protein [Candidatus Neomarinimicrobiota bacterium]MCF7828291.1 FecR family protein [Candidatus Neomarinimicrobiota bacterium]MCF7879534.1 FecR family protein [Candidatus Neomarinimicrobiota bacterium]
MKKKNIHIILFTTLLLLWQPMAMAAPEMIAAVLKVKGNVEVRRTGGEMSVTAIRGQQLSQGDWIVTGDNEYAALLFLDKSLLKIHENSEVEIRSQRSAANQQDTRVHMNKGEIYSDVKEGSYGHFEVITSTSVAAVKGTEFYLEVNDTDGSTTLTVINGVVEFTNDLGTILAEAQMQSKAEAGKSPEQPRKIPKNQIPTWEQEVEPDWGVNLNPEKQGQQPIQSPVKIGLQIRDLNSQSSVSNYSGAVNVSSEREGVVFSTDGKKWTNQVSFNITNGRSTFQAKALDKGTHKIVVGAEDVASGDLSMSFYRTETQKKALNGKLERVAQKKGLKQVADRIEGRTISASSVEGGGAVDDLLQKVESGEYEIAGVEEIENPDGSITLRLAVRPGGQREGGQK